MATRQATKESKVPATGRVVCRIPNAGDCIDGIDFGLIPGDTPEALPIRVSDVVPAGTLTRFCSIEGYALFEGDDADAADAVQAARDARRISQPAAGSAHEIEELRRANMAMGDDLTAANQRVIELEKQVAAGGDTTARNAQVVELTDRITLLERQAAERDSYIATLEEKLPK